MKRFLFSAFALLLTAAFSFSRQDITGDWQATLEAGPQRLRTVLQVAKNSNAGWTATMYSLDQTSSPIPVDSVTLQDSTVRFVVNVVNGHYEGELSADGASIEGAWTQGGRSIPLNFRRATKETAWKLDESTHKIHFVTVDKDVKLEVLDWDGAGKPLVLLAGFGNDAHIFDKIASKLAASYHVYGITRRGFGKSSAPSSGYSPDRLGDDVLAVMDALKIGRPVLVGHSIAGEELSNVGWRHPERVSGLIYLDAHYTYSVGMKEPPQGIPARLASILLEIEGGQDKYTEIKLPALAICAEASRINAEALKKVVTSVRVVRLPNAQHHVFLSNEADVLREMKAFLDRFP